MKEVEFYSIKHTKKITTYPMNTLYIHDYPVHIIKMITI